MDLLAAIRLHPQPHEQQQRIRLEDLHPEVLRVCLDPIACFSPVLLTAHHSHLTPGGYLELQEFSLPLSDDGTLTPAHALQKSMNLLQEAAAATNHAFVDIHNLKAMLTDAGFVDVVEVKYKWPSNTWPQDPKFKEIGEWNNYNIKAGMEGFLMAALTRALGWRQEEVSALAAQAKIDLDDRGVHAYWPM